MGEGGIDDDGDLGVRVVTSQLGDSLLELCEARERSSFGGDVRPVNDDVLYRHVLVVKHSGAPLGRNAAYRSFEKVLVLELVNGTRPRRGAS